MSAADTHGLVRVQVLRRPCGGHVCDHQGITGAPIGRERASNIAIYEAIPFGRGVFDRALDLVIEPGKQSLSAIVTTLTFGAPWFEPSNSQQFARPRELKRQFCGLATALQL